MLAKARRIDRNTFKTLVGRGLQAHSPRLFLSIYKKSDESPSQFAFLCSKKVSPKAVKRNTLRRQGYTVIQTLLSRITPGVYCVFSFKKEAQQGSFEDIEKDIVNLLTSAKLLL